MSLTSLPTVGGVLGPVKSDNPWRTPDTSRELSADEWNAAAAALQAVCAQVGLNDGSTSGSLTQSVTLLFSAFQGFLGAGDWSPTVQATTNVSGATLVEAHYTRLGEILTVTGSVNVTATAGAGALTVVTMDIDGAFESPMQTVYGATSARTGASTAFVNSDVKMSSAGALTLSFIASAIGTYNVGFTISYVRAT